MTRATRAWSAQLRRLAAIGLVLLSCSCARCSRGRALPASEWMKLQDGLTYTTFKHLGAQFHVLRVDLTRVGLRISDARQIRPPIAPVAVLTRAVHGLAGVNGTFFDDDHKPIGWLVSDGKQLNPLHDTSWWAALVVREEADQPVAEVLTTEAVKALTPVLRASVRFAIQVGPRTVVDGKPLRLKPQTAERTAACVTRPQEVLLLVTNGTVPSNELAEIMALPEADGGLGCQSGLMFDGGPSTQLSIQTDKLKLEVPGGWGVPDAVVVVPEPISLTPPQ